MSKVSIITPFYKGNAYMYKYCDMVRSLRANLTPGLELEVIIVNDSPDDQVQLVGDTGIEVIDMPENGGIHKSRLMGLAQSTGEFVIFLDQDDILSPTAVSQLYGAIGTAGIAIGNASLENRNGTDLWYRTDYHKSVIWDIETYISVGTQIMSPGQCLIRKSSIPKVWKDNPLTNNGSDDYYLWILMICAGVKHVYVDEVTYTHCCTGENISGSTLATDASTMEFIDILENYGGAPAETIKRLRKMIQYKADFRAGNKLKKVAKSLEHLPTFAKNLSYKKRTATPYGFNR